MSINLTSLSKEINHCNDDFEFREYRKYYIYRNTGNATPGTLHSRHIAGVFANWAREDGTPLRNSKLDVSNDSRTRYARMV